jgi:membrane fusion protein (multidrug efflux system)
MAIAFSRTTRALDIDSGRSSVAAVAVALLLLAVWMLWFTLGRVTVYEVSRTAQVEVSSAVRDIATLGAGRLVTSGLVIGRHVHAGDILGTLDADHQALQLAEAEARQAGFPGRLSALRRELAGAEAAQSGAQRAGDAERAAAVAQSRAAEATASFTASLAHKQAADAESGGAAPVEAERALAEAHRAAATRDAARENEARVAGEASSRNAALAADIARITATIAALENEQATMAMQVSQRRRDLALRAIRAPVDGIIGAVAPRRLGEVLAAGSLLATIVPDGDLHIVAAFDPASGLGRLAAGQTGRLRLDGFSWAQYGDFQATVERVAADGNATGLRVELGMVRPRNASLALRHGMTGRVEVAIEAVSPAVLLLRAIGLKFS